MANYFVYVFIIAVSFQFIDIEAADRNKWSRINMLAERVEANDRMVSGFRNELIWNTKELQATKRAFQDTKNELQETKEELHETKVELERVKRTLAGKQMSKKEGFQDDKGLTPANPAIMRAFANEKVKLHKLVAELANEMTRYETDVTSFKRDLEFIINNNTDVLKAEIARYGDNVTSFKREIDAILQENSAVIKEEIARYENDVTSFRKDVKTIMKENDDIKEELERSESDVTSFKNKIERVIIDNNRVITAAMARYEDALKSFKTKMESVQRRSYGSTTFTNNGDISVTSSGGGGACGICIG